MAGSVVHLCGHLHTLADAAPNMYGRHPDGHLELELADFKDHRRCALVCVCVCSLMLCSTAKCVCVCVYTTVLVFVWYVLSLSYTVPV